MAKVPRGPHAAAQIAHDDDPPLVLRLPGPHAVPRAHPAEDHLKSGESARGVDQSYHAASERALCRSPRRLPWCPGATCTAAAGPPHESSGGSSASRASGSSPCLGNHTRQNHQQRGRVIRDQCSSGGQQASGVRLRTASGDDMTAVQALSLSFFERRRQGSGCTYSPPPRGQWSVSCHDTLSDSAYDLPPEKCT